MPDGPVFSINLHVLLLLIIISTTLRNLITSNSLHFIHRFTIVFNVHIWVDITLTYMLSLNRLIRSHCISNGTTARLPRPLRPVIKSPTDFTIFCFQDLRAQSYLALSFNASAFFFEYLHFSATQSFHQHLLQYVNHIPLILKYCHFSSVRSMWHNGQFSRLLLETLMSNL